MTATLYGNSSTVRTGVALCVRWGRFSLCPKLWTVYIQPEGFPSCWVKVRAAVDDFGNLVEVAA